MAKMTIERNFFETRSEVMQDIGKSGFWPTTFVSDHSPELPVHYHNQDIIGYVMEGHTYLLDEEGNKQLIGPGDKLNIPKGAWHAEGEVTEKVVYIVTLPEPMSFMEALAPQEPRGPWPDMSS